MANHVTEASDMLAAALEQMDGIIAGTKIEFQNGLVDNGSPKLGSKMNNFKVMKQVEELRTSVEKCEDRSKVFNQMPLETQNFLRDWLVNSTDIPSNGGVGGGAYSVDGLEEKIRRLESDKESLILQVSVLTDQVEAQGEKIRELEGGLASKKDSLIMTEDMLQHELISRSSLETHKLDLMAEISNLKLRLATAEKGRRDLEDKFDLAQRQISELHSKLNEREMEVLDLRTKLSKNGTIPSFAEHTENEVEKLKSAVESLMAANHEKDRSIDELRKMLKRYKRVEEMVLSKGKRGLEGLEIPDDHSDSSSTTNNSVPSSSDVTMREAQPQVSAEFDFLIQDSDPIRILSAESANNTHHHSMPIPNATSTPVNVNTYSDSHKPTMTVIPNGNTNGNGVNSPKSTSSISSPPSTIADLTLTPPRKYPSIARSNSCEEITPLPPKTPPRSRRLHEGFGTLPKDRDTDSARKNKGFASFAQTELADSEDESQIHAVNPKGSSTPLEKKKSKGIRKFFGRLRRTSSQDLDKDAGDFKRGGVRATAGARLGWSKDLKSDLEVPFSRWDTDQVATWLHRLGLSMYVGECKRWVRNGQQLLNCTHHDLEKELGIRHPLHRKKLQLALQTEGKETTGAVLIDHHWVTKWLDDIGLPQYKDSFSEARVDGRMLNYLTVDDLIALKVTNTLHHLSIKRGIQVLRLNNFEPGCLKRRPAQDEPGQLVNIPEEVILWTNHRVMEWLRSIDLSEYAPNLRGSGVHGALMVCEARFSAHLFADLLSIPANKTLLRRHLSTHFVYLIGQDVQQRKRENEASVGYTPLTPNAKIKIVRKRGIFGHKRSKSETDCDDFLCPLDLNEPVTPVKNGNGVAGYKTEIRGLEGYGGPDNQPDDKAAKEIGAFSQEINSLTTMLARDQFFDDVPTSNV